MTNENKLDVCDYLSRISPYYDGELPIEERHAVEEHLTMCVSCAGLLIQLQGLSHKLQQLSVPAVENAVLNRLHNRIDYYAWRRLEQIAGVLTGLAACLALAAAIKLMQPATLSPVPAPWERAALQQTDDTSATNGRDVELAHWMVADLSSQDSGQDGGRP